MGPRSQPVQWAAMIMVTDHIMSYSEGKVDSGRGKSSLSPLPLTILQDLGDKAATGIHLELASDDGAWSRVQMPLPPTRQIPARAQTNPETANECKDEDSFILLISE